MGSPGLRRGGGFQMSRGTGVPERKRQEWRAVSLEDRVQTPDVISNAEERRGRSLLNK